MDAQHLSPSATDLLKSLIAIPRTSRHEDEAARKLAGWMMEHGLSPTREKNNVWCKSEGFNPDKPTILLNAHIDTVAPVDSWTRCPYKPETDSHGRIYGLGSNDCGGGLVALLHTFIALNDTTQDYNLIFLATAEEEISGTGGMQHMVPLLPPIALAIVGEPTGMQPAIAEKGLMVLDLTTHGRAGHAARQEGVNAIYEAIDDLNWIRTYTFEKVSPLLGPTLMQATAISGGNAHNVVPDRCHITVDVRTNDLYTNQEVLDIIRSHVKSDAEPRSMRLNPSHIDPDHPFVARAIAIGKTPFGSPTLSDQALMPWTSLKMGPGESSRSHTADEYIYDKEIDDAIKTYIRLLDGLQL